MGSGDIQIGLCGAVQSASVFLSFLFHPSPGRLLNNVGAEIQKKDLPLTLSAMLTFLLGICHGSPANSVFFQPQCFFNM